MTNIQIYPKNSKQNNEVYKMPWRYDATCYNFHNPEVFIPDDAIDEKIKDPMDVDTLVVTADLEDYGFIAEMKNLRQLYLYNAKNLTNLSFMEELIYLRQICIMHSKVRCLDGLDALLNNKKMAIDSGTDDFQGRITYGIEGIYIHSDESSVRLTSIHDYGVYIGELNLNLYTGESSDKIRALIVKSSGEYEVMNIKKGSESLQSIVGGNIEELTFHGHTDFIMFMNEKGRILNLPINSKATVFSLEFVEEISIIYGDVVICGLDEEGDSCDLSDEQINQFSNILSHV